MRFACILKRGSTPIVERYTGPEGELVYDKGMGTLRLHDDVKEGGHILQKNGSVGYRPRIVSPSSNVAIEGSDLHLTFTPFEGVGESFKVRAVASIHPDFAELAYDTGWVNDNGSLTLPLDQDVAYHVRLMQMSDRGVSTPWSKSILITTGAGYFTYFTVQRQTSHSTEFSRTTEFETTVGGYRQTWEADLYTLIPRAYTERVPVGAPVNTTVTVGNRQFYMPELLLNGPVNFMSPFDPEGANGVWAYRGLFLDGSKQVNTQMQRYSNVVLQTHDRVLKLTAHFTMTYDASIKETRTRQTYFAGQTYYETEAITSVYTEG